MTDTRLSGALWAYEQMAHSRRVLETAEGWTDDKAAAMGRVLRLAEQEIVSKASEIIGFGVGSKVQWVGYPSRTYTLTKGYVRANWETYSNPDYLYDPFSVRSRIWFKGSCKRDGEISTNSFSMNWFAPEPWKLKSDSAGKWKVV